MKTVLFLILSMLLTASAACDLRSGIARKNMEKYTSTPAPSSSPAAVETPPYPADVVTVDTAIEGRLISIDGHGKTQTAECTKLDRVHINGNTNVIRIKGVCRQVMVNGDQNQLTADAVMEFVLNGSENVVKYSRLVNGKRPSVVENKSGNTIEKAERQSSEATKGNSR